MGTLMGHVLPGSFFLVFSIWWCANILSRYSRSRHRRQQYRSSLTFPCCCCGRLELEGTLKLVCCSVGLVGEIVTALDSSGKWVHIGNGQHATMFSVFGFSGIVDILTRHCPTSVPEGANYLFSCLCFCVEGLLFMFHLHGRSSTDVAVHTLLVYVVWACAAAAVAELKWPRSPLVALARVFFVALQGTWFVQVGFLLYPPVPWLSNYAEGSQHVNTMVATIIFGWHMFFIFLAMLLMGVVIDRREAGLAPAGGRSANGKRGGGSVRLLGDDDSRRLVTGGEEGEDDEEIEVDVLSDLDTRE